MTQSKAFVIKSYSFPTPSTWSCVIKDKGDFLMRLSPKIILKNNEKPGLWSLVMDPDLLLQNHILPPALSEQMALHRLRKRKHSHCQRGVLHSLRLRHYVEQSHRTVSLFPPLPFLLTGSLHYLLSCPGPVYTHPGIYEKQTNVSAETVCPVHWEDCGSASAKLGLYSLNDWKWGCLILFCLLFVLKWNKRWTYN